MKSLILDKGEKYYTFMKKIFQVIDNEQLKYNWLITGCECYPLNEDYLKLFSKEFIWISGEHLTTIINNEDFQFIWGVFTGFSIDISLEDVLKYELPTTDYKGYWIDDVSIQHPLADVEIVAFDSSFTLFMSKNNELIEKFQRGFPLSEDLSARNTKENAEIAHIEDLLTSELKKRRIQVNEEILDIKYSIWRELYSKSKKMVTDKDIIQSVNYELQKKRF